MADQDETSVISKSGEVSFAAISELAKDPKFQSILQKHLDASHRGFYESLPLPVKRRVRALKNLQVDIYKLEAQFYEEIQQLEAKYQGLYQPLLDKREQIINGTYEPSPDECKWADSDDEGEEGDSKDKESTAVSSTDESAPDGIVANGEKEPDGNIEEEPDKGIPSFWLQTMKKIDIFEDYIMEHDEPILRHLTDIKLKYSNDKGLDFTLEFHFSDNEYFTNKVLTKTYTMSCELAPDDPFSFEGAAITGVNGCKIDWKKGKNVTVKTIKKKQKHKGKGQSRVITKTVPNESFFTFFTPPDPDTFASKEEEEVEELSVQLESDISRAEFFRDRLIPKAVLYFTGDLLDDEEDDSEMGVDEDEEEGDESDLDDDYNPKSDLQNAKPQECKQQ